MKFRMVDRILEWQPQESIRGTKTVSFEEYQLKSSMAAEPHLPESLLMESIFQLGNWLIMLSSEFTQMGIIVRTQEIRFLDIVKPGQSLRLEAHATSYRDDGISIDGRILVDGRVIAEGKGCLALPVQLVDYHDPDDMRVLYSEIFRPQNPQTASN